MDAPGLGEWLSTSSLLRHVVPEGQQAFPWLVILSTDSSGSIEKKTEA